MCEYDAEIECGGPSVNKKSSQLLLAVSMLALLLGTDATAQIDAKQLGSANSRQTAVWNAAAGNTSVRAQQSVVNSLSTLPEADALIYISPQRILNDAVPKVMDAAAVAKMRAAFDDVKKSVGLDPSKVDYLVIAVRIRKPGADLSFLTPDVMIVASGDFSADSLLTAARLSLEPLKLKVRDEKYGSKTLTLLTIDAITEAAEKNPMLKSFSEIGFVPLNANTIAVGNSAYIRAAVDAGDGKGRITTAALESLLRDPAALISSIGSPLSSFAKSFGLLGTETSPRESHCDSKLGDYYSAITMDATNFRLSGAMNADNPDTAKIISNLLSGLLQQVAASVTDKNAQTVMKSIKIMPKESEVVWEGDISQQVFADFVREQMKPKPAAIAGEKPSQSPSKRPVKRRRTVHKS